MNYRSHAPKHHHRSGFTLVELLVVIAIIATLVGISFTVFRNIRATVNESTSASNMRQIGIAIQTYVAEKGRYPSPGNMAGDEFQIPWDRILMPYLADPDFDYKAGRYVAIREKTPEAAAAKSAINLLYCPGDDMDAPSGQFRRSYAMCPWTVTQGGSGFRNGFATITIGHGPPPAKIEDPATAVVLIEFRHPNNIVGTAAYDYMFGFLEMPQKNNKPADYHKKNQLLLFVDGHVAQSPGNISQPEWRMKGYSPHIDRVTGAPK